MANIPELMISRVFSVPRDRVWQAWTDPAQIAQWWGPRGVTNPTCEWDARPEGKIRVVMLAGKELGPLAGQEWPMTGMVKEVAAPRRLVFSSSAIVDGEPILENLVTVTLEDKGGETIMTLNVVVTMTTPKAAGPLQGMEQGWTQSIDKLGEYLSR